MGMICTFCGASNPDGAVGKKCVNCGYPLKEDKLGLTQFGDLLDGKIQDEKLEKIANCRRNLWDAAHERYLSNAKIASCCAELKKLLPQDFLANFYEKAVDKNPLELNAFLDGIDVKASADYLGEVIDFTVNSLDLKNVLSLEHLIERAKDSEVFDVDSYVEAMGKVQDEAKRLDDGLYEPTIPRHVFVAYSSKDMPRVNKIVSWLEEREIRCFVAMRNLRHGKGAVENYEKALETAMKNCKCVLFLSSEHSRSLSCDALSIELPYIRDNLQNLPRVEYILDEYGAATSEAAKTLLKSFFSGLEFCRTDLDLLSRITNYITYSKSEKPSFKYCSNCGEQNPVNARFCAQCACGEFVPTYREYADRRAEAERHKAEEEYAKKQRENEEKLRLETERKLEEERKKYERELEELKRQLAEKQAAPAEKPAATPAPAANKSVSTPAEKNQENAIVYDPDEFEIKGTVLKKYNGRKTEVVIPDGVTTICNWAFNECESLKSIIIPNSVTSIGDNVFRGCSSVKEITIPNSVTSIGKSAFQNCSSLTKITIPQSVTSIGKLAFSGCSGLTTITVKEGNQNYHIKNNCLIETKTKILIRGCENSIIPSDGSVTSIGDRAFNGCSSLKEITIPNGVTSIGNGAFDWCKSLKNITIPNSVTSIGYNAFNCCSSLKNITIPNSVTLIGNRAFSSCSSLKEITIPNGVTSIGGAMFDDCKSLTKIAIPNGVTSIGSGAFEGCESLKEITIPNSVNSIGRTAFFRCSGLTSITLPLSITSIGDYAFNSCNNLTIYCEANSQLVGWNKNWNGSCKVVWGYNNTNSEEQIKKTAPAEKPAVTPAPAASKSSSTSTEKKQGVSPIIYDRNEFKIEGTVLKKYKGNKTEVVIPDGVTGIAFGAFDGCKSLTNITIPNSVTSIDYYAFRACVSLKEITIPNGVTSIGKRAFNGCGSLKEIAIPNSVTSIGEDAFAGCINLTNVIIPNSVTSIGNHAFCYCESLTKITIPNSVTSIGARAFEDCENLIEITIPNGVTSIGDRTFYGCSRLTNITIPKSVTSIGGSAFRGCESLKEITIPNGVTSIGDWTFMCCNSLKEITIPNSVTSIGHCAFSGCSGLTNITIPNSVTSIGEDAFRDCESMKEIAIPNSVTSIGGRAFRGCESLKEITIPNGVTSIGGSAFEYCSGLKNITIPNGVTSIGKDAFYGCPALTIYCEANSCPVGWHKDWNIKRSWWVFKKRCKTVWGYKKK